MAWITTDTDAARTLVVQKVAAGQPLPGYPKSYSLLDAFGSYPAITVDQWHKMNRMPRDERIAAFKLYVGQAEGLNVDATQTNDVYRPSEEVPGEIVEV